MRTLQATDADRVPALHPNISSVSDQGVAFIAGFEGFSAKPYWDAIGRIWTIGYGETHGVTATTPPVTRAGALARLRARVNHDYLAPVLRVANAVGLQLRPCEADALALARVQLWPRCLRRGPDDGQRIA